MKEKKTQYVWWAGTVLLLLTTFFLRTWDLTGVPPGLTHDEASNGHDASAILTGHHALYFPVGYGHEPLFNYSVAAMTYIIGEGIFTLRYTSVIWSLLTWCLTVALSRRWWGRGAALLTAAVITTSFWAQMMGRVGLRAPVLAALFTGSVLLYDRAATRRHHAFLNFILSGFLLGAGFYTYMASRGLPLIFVSFLVILVISKRFTLDRIWRGTILVLVTALLTGLPLIIYLTNHPELEQRVGQLGGAIIAFFDGNWQPLMKNIVDSLPLLLWQADPRWLYNIGERAALEPLYAVFFCVGLVVAVVKVGRPRHLFLLLWLGCGLAPALLTSVEYNTLHAIAAMPAAFLLVTLGLVSVVKKLAYLLHKPYSMALYTGLVIAFILTGIQAMQAYFIHWGQNRDVRVAYHHATVSLGRELASSRLTSPVVISSLYPGQFHNPYTMDVTLGSLNLPIRWVDGRSAVLVPATLTRLYIDPQTMFPETLWSFIKPDVQPYHNLVFKPDDIPQDIEAYLWESNTTWTTIISTFNNNFYAYEGQENIIQNAVDLDAPVNFDGIISLNGYQVAQSFPPSGDYLTLLTAWSVLQATEDEMVIFVHLLNQDGTILAQQDLLAVPSWQWEKGDRFIHMHELALPQDTPLDETMMAVGIYRREDLTRLAIVHQTSSLSRTLIHLGITDK